MPRPKKRGTSVKLTINLAPQVRDVLETLKHRVSADTLSEVVREALALYDAVSEHQESGGRVLLEAKDGEFVQVLRIL